MAGEEKVSQYFRKIIIVAVLQLFCVLLVAITRILEKYSLPERFFKIIDIFQCMLWPFLICLFSLTGTTRREIANLFKCNHEEENKESTRDRNTLNISLTLL